ncbi:MAG: tetratricopeptide repeat protein [Candidatus Hodarchaeota archaeon]
MKKKTQIENQFSRASNSLAHGELQEAEDALKQVIKQALQKSFWDLAGKAFAKLGRCYLIQGRYIEAKSAYSWGESFATKIADYETLNRALNGLGMTDLKMGKPERARKYLEEALQVGRAINDPSRIAASLNNLGIVNRQLGDLSSATRVYEEARIYLQETKQKAATLAILINLGTIYGMQGQLDQSDRLYDEGLEIVEDDPERLGLLKLNKAYNEFIRDSPATAAKLLQEGLETVTQHGIGGSLRVNLQLGLAQAFIEMKHFEEALKAIETIEENIDNSHPLGKAELLFLRGKLLLSTSHRFKAKEYFQKALRKARDLPSLSIELSSLVRLAEIALREFETSGDNTKMDQAMTRLEDALQLAGRERIYYLIIEVMNLKALLSASLCQFDRANYELQAALKLAEEHELANYRTKVKENIFFVKTQQEVLKAYDQIDSEAELQVRDLSFQHFRNYLRDIEAMAKSFPQ